MKKLLPALLCLAAPFIATAQITVSTSQYTTSELVNTVLTTNAFVPGANITSKTGTDYGSSNGIGYFQNNNSGFAFESGIILSTGGATYAPGPLTNSNDGATEWLGDDDLTAMMNTDGFSISRNASVLEFDFVALQDHISLEYIFASNEYGLFQCTYGDALGIFIKDNTSTLAPTNIAVVPGTTTRVSTISVRNNLYNTNCTSVNAQYFGNYYSDTPTTSPVNFRGATAPLTAETTVIPGHSYHIKIAIADRQDTSYDSAIFIKAGSFNTGNINTDDIVITSSMGSILCSGYSTELSVPGNAYYIYQWSYNGMAIANATANTFTTDQAGDYSVSISIAGTTISTTASITIVDGGGITELLNIEDQVVFEDNTDGVAEFDLSVVQAQIEAQITSAGTYTITFHETVADAVSNGNALVSSTYTNSLNPQQLQARIENENGCYTIVGFNLIVQETVVAPTGETDQTFEPGDTLADVEVDGENILWYDTDGTITGPPTGADDPLPLTTVLEDGKTYYASQTVGGYESQERFPVTVHILLGLDSTTLSGLLYYPNPVKNVVTFSNTSNIDTIAIVNITGQTVLNISFDNTTAQIDLSGLSDGIYFAKIASDGKTKTIKIIKK